MKRPGRRPASVRGVAPEVIVDFAFDDGLLYVSLQNVGDVPAYDVRVGFDPPFRGLGGEREMSALRMFRNTPFLGPRRTIRSFLDSGAAYFARGEPREIAVHVAYRGADRRQHRRTIRHDLAIFEDLAFVVPGASAAADR